MSRNAAKPAYRVPVYLSSRGYNTIPVNPFTKKIMARRSYPSLKDVPAPVDIVQVFRRSNQALNTVRDALERKRQRSDVEVIWLQEGIENEEARRLALDAGVVFIQNRCMYKELRRLLQKKSEE